VTQVIKGTSHTGQAGLSHDPDFQTALDYVFGLPTATVNLCAIALDVHDIQAKTFKKTSEGRAAAEKWLQEQNVDEKRNVYYQDVSVSTVNRRPKKEDATLIHYAHTDIDVKQPQKVVAAEKKAILAKLRAHAPPPSIIVYTGNGFQALWLLAEPLENTITNRERIEAINAALTDALGGDATCKDICHLLRVPGSINYPNAKKRAAGRVVVDSKLIEDNFDFYACRLDELPQGTVQERGENGSEVYDAEPFDIDELEPNFRDLMVKGPPEGANKIGDGSRSAFTYHCAATLREQSYSDENIIWAATNPAFAMAVHILDQKQRSPEAQASRIINDLDKKGVVAIYSRNAEEFEGEYLPGGRTTQPLPPMRRGAVKTLRDVTNNYVWVVEIERWVRRSDCRKFKEKQFDTKFNRFTKKQSISRELFKSERIHVYDTLTFEPEQDEVVTMPPETPGAEPVVAYNLWRASPIVPKQGDTTLWNEHVEYLFPVEAERETLLNWFAWLLQHPSEHPNWAILIVGEQTGTGKSMVGRVFEQIVGMRNTKRPKNSSIGGDFNGWAENCRFAFIEEMMQIGRRENLNALRDMITEPQFEVNIKNVPAFQVWNRMGLFGITNHLNALPIDWEDRRWGMVQAAEKRSTEAHYAAMAKLLRNPAALGAIAWELRHRDLKDFDPTGLAPESMAKRVMQEKAGGEVAEWMFENKDNYPLCRGVLTTQDIIDAMPSDLVRQRGSRAVVRETLIKGLHAVAYKTQIRPDPADKYKKVRVWLMGDLAAKAETITLSEVQAIYREESKGKTTAVEMLFEE